MQQKLVLFFISALWTISLFADTSHPVFEDRSAKIFPIQTDTPMRQDYAVFTLREASGYLWIATDNGLKRYDGYSIRSFSQDHQYPKSLGSPHANVLLTHSDGSLWIGANTLNQYHADTETFSRFGISDYREIHAMHEDEHGDIWIGGERLGLLQFRPKTGEVIQRYFNETPGLFISDIIQKRNSTSFWLATSRGLLLFDPKTGESVTHFLPLDNSGSKPLYNPVEDNDGNIWIGTLNGLYIVPSDGGTPYVMPLMQPNNGKELPGNLISALARDQAGNIWIGTDKFGIYQYNYSTKHFIHYPASTNDAMRFPPGRITHIQEDKEGHLWFAVGHYGIYRMSPDLQKFRNFQQSFDTDNSLGFNNVMTIHEDMEGDIWIATDGMGLDRLDPKTQTFTHFRHNPNDPYSISNDSVLDITEDSQGHLWIATWAGGLNKFDKTTQKFTHFIRDPHRKDEQTLIDNHVFRVVADEQDRLIMAVGNSGLQTYDIRNNRYESYFPGKSNSGDMRSDFINVILPVGGGRYWIGGYKGLELFSPDEPERIFQYFPLPQTDPIHDLFMSSEGLLWIGSKGGLWRFNPSSGEAVRFTTKDGLSDDHIVGIAQDKMGYLWISTQNGLNRFDPITKEVEQFTEQDGLPGAQFNRRSRTQTKSGKMYFGTTQGFTLFDPLHMPRNEFAPKLHFIDLYINRQQQIPYQSRWLLNTINFVDQLVLPHSAYDIQVKLSATNLVAPMQNQYRYRILGLNDEWIPVSPELRTVQMNNLSAGRYQLQVIAANNDNVWTGATKNLNITILPAWWQTWWAYILYAIAFFAVLYLFSVWRLRLTIQRRQELEKLVHEQTVKLKEANRAISQLNTELEQRVAQRTRDLSAEVEERKESEAKATYIAYHDALTGLYNRAWLLQHLESLLLQRERSTHSKETPSSSPFALLFIGGDRFRKINDTYGHKIGDKLLVAAADKLQNICGSKGHIARLGSDEFAVLIETLDSPQKREHIASLAEQLVQHFLEPIVIDHMRLLFSISIGFVVADHHYNDASQIVRNANIAMQRAKDRGRAMWQEFDEEILQQTLDLAALEADLKLALAHNQFSVVYQPLVSLSPVQITGFEVLIRWKHPERGMIPPDKFIAMAEASGQIFDIGLWVLEQACLQLHEWKKQLSDRPLPLVAVNLSPVQLERMDFLEKIHAIFERTNVDPAWIEFEITETALLRHTDTVNDVLEELRRSGIKLAIDDFGTGYSSLSYLDKLPVQVLKIDRSFVNALASADNNSTAEIIRATISLAHNLGLTVVAEGIETQQQMDTLTTYGCDFGQGYFIARPLAPADATDFLLGWKNNN